MGQQYSAISEKHQAFIQTQRIFFVATAMEDSRVNLSPKGMESLKILDENRVVWLNLTGSGNESAAHVQINPRMTLMFLAFDGSPLILRLYGYAEVIHQGDDRWAELYAHFPEQQGARQIFDMKVDLVQTSCGMSVPLYDYVADRPLLKDWAEKRQLGQIREYWQKNNQLSLDGIPTHIMEKS